MATVTVVLYRPVIAQWSGWSGEIGRNFHRLALEVKGAQKGLVAKRSGRLAQSIDTGGREHWVAGLQIDVGGHTRYAAANDQGASPHKIYPRNPNGMLVFFWGPPNGPSKVVRMRSVNHPGNKGAHWAERGMRIGLARWN